MRLRRIRAEVSAADRARLIAETRRWVIRDLRSGSGSWVPAPRRSRPTGSIPDSLAQLLLRFDESRMEYWNDDDWERLTLQALWRICCDGVRDQPPFSTVPPLAIRPRDVLLEATGVDTDLLVDDRLIPFCASFLDQGFARWRLPRRDEGFYRAFCSLYRLSWGPPDRWLHGLADEVGRLLENRIGPLESTLEVSEDPGGRRGGVGAISVRHVSGPARLGRDDSPDRASRRPGGSRRAPGSLVEFLAVRLLLDRFAVGYTARTSLGIKTPVHEFWRLARGWVDPQRQLEC